MKDIMVTVISNLNWEQEFVSVIEISERTKMGYSGVRDKENLNLSRNRIANKCKEV